MENIQIAIDAIKQWIAAGRPRMEWANSNLPQARDAVAAALKVDIDYFWRGTNRAEEINDVKNGIQIFSKNYVDDLIEAGMSVSNDLGTVWAYGYKYAYKCVGTVSGAGSDGEPVIVEARPISEMYEASAAIDNDEQRAAILSKAKQIADGANISIEMVLWIEART